MGLSAAPGNGARYLLGIDAGQTFTKAVLFTEDGKEVAIGSVSVATSSPRPEWQERDMGEVWRRTAEAIAECVRSSGVPAERIAAVGLGAHNDGMYLVDAAGEPVRPAILATDARATREAMRLASGAARDLALAETGQVPAPYSPSALLAWLEANEPESLERGRWYLFCKDWLRLKLTGRIGTDPSEASASFTNLRSQEWSDEALAIYGLSRYRHLLPPIHGSASAVGSVTAEAASLTGLRAGTPVVTGAHDVDAAALGIGAVGVGALSIIMGTFSINQVVAGQPVVDPRWQARTFLQPQRWLHMSTSPSGASNFEWAVRNFGQSDAAKPDYNQWVEAARLDVPEAFANSPFFLPFLYGAPVGYGESGGTLTGVRGSHDRGDIMRAVLEGVVYNHRWHVDALRERFAIKGAVRLCGGGAKNRRWSQLMANALQLPIEVTDADEAGARGAAMLAGIGAGIYSGLDDAIGAAVRVIRTHEPDAGWGPLLDGRFARYRQLMELTRHTQF